MEIKEIKARTKRQIYEDQLREKYNKEDINQYFEEIKKNKILGWENKLIESKLDIRDFSKVNDAEILNEQFEDEKTERIIRGDLERTRVNECIYMKSFKEYSFQLIIYYIKKANISYKQGLNEIAGPFILLKYKLSITFTEIYKMFVCFIDKFLTNYFHENEFFSLKSSLSLINLLLRYHDPELFNKFDYSMINSDLYATSWILTLFANKCSLNVIYHLWDKLILFDDILFIHFFITAYLIKNRKIFFDAESCQILSILSQLHIDTIEEVNDILNFATEIRDKTPNSFYIFAKKLEIFNFDSPNLKKLYEEYKPNKMKVIPIFPSEILNIAYKYKIGCSNEKCENFLISNKKFNNLEKCIFCRNKKIKSNIIYIIIDLRIFKDENNIGKGKHFSASFPGYLPKTIIFMGNKELNNILEKYKNDREKIHIIIITSESEYFHQYENDFYKDKELRNSKAGVFFKSDKILDMNKVNELDKKSREYSLLKEYVNFKKIIKEIENEKFKYISFAYGGYNNIHSSALKYNIELLEHGNNCFICKEEKEKNEKNSSFFDNFFK